MASGLKGKIINTTYHCQTLLSHIIQYFASSMLNKMFNNYTPVITEYQIANQ